MLKKSLSQSFSSLKKEVKPSEENKEVSESSKQVKTSKARPGSFAALISQ